LLVGFPRRRVDEEQRLGEVGHLDDAPLNEQAEMPAEVDERGLPLGEPEPDTLRVARAIAAAGEVCSRVVSAPRVGR
jgi:hypothetical protein